MSSRRRWLGWAATAALAPPWAGGAVAAAAPATGPPLARTLPSTGEAVCPVGMGTWLTFDFDTGDPGLLAQRRAVLQTFFAAGGQVVDSSPMYGHAEEALGLLLGPARAAVPQAAPLFCATKVWTPVTALGRTQMQRSLDLWRLPRSDLMQVHNLLNWRGHLATLREWRAAGRTRLVGITTSHGRAHDEVRAIVRSERLDALQITYNPADRSAEPLIALAADRGLAVLINRPFDGGAALSRLAGRPLPGLARELGCASWASFVLKWELSLPGVTCVIPATTRVDHMLQNMAALQGPQPDAGLRARMLAAMEAA